MSKAFTRENDDLEPEMALSKATLPTGIPNYLTSDGAQRLREELITLLERRKQNADAAADEQAQAELRRVNGRIQTVSQILAGADIVSVSQDEVTEVRFGMFVTVRDGHDAEDEYRIVGVDEVDLERGWISWHSPFAKALIGRKPGETVHFQAPAGERILHIMRIRAPGAAS